MPFSSFQGHQAQTWCTDYTCIQNTHPHPINIYLFLKYIWNLQESVFSCAGSLFLPLYYLMHWSSLWFWLSDSYFRQRFFPTPIPLNLLFWFSETVSQWGDSLWRICYYLVTEESITEYKAPLLTFVGNPFVCIACFSIISWCISLHNNPRLLKPFWIQIPKLFWIWTWLFRNLLISHSWLTLE